MHQHTFMSVKPLETSRNQKPTPVDLQRSAPGAELPAAPHLAGDRRALHLELDLQAGTAEASLCAAHSLDTTF